ncbi:SRPBCC family protein [Rhodococcus sp. UNC363MFTsu5.1]|uniref:SRPBCC family protein n=1 Tax=Rhodococcus sp. UNC363MFTsu5.1 TaxID=1449069 RepID=UPI0009E094BA|nr:SRPBCC domain-containing protein [Rhodococcus sp. UNC363MFTsu5.1]
MTETSSARQVGLTRDAGWEIGVSKTLPYPVEAVWRLLSGHPAVWLGIGAVLPEATGGAWRADDGTRGELRSRREHDRIRLTWRPRNWTHDSTVQVAMRETATGTVVRFHQERLADQGERERQREHWRAVLGRLEAALSQ